MSKNKENALDNILIFADNVLKLISRTCDDIVTDKEVETNALYTIKQIRQMAEHAVFAIETKRQDLGLT